jgi:hypothetical protein
LQNGLNHWEQKKNFGFGMRIPIASLKRADLKLARIGRKSRHHENWGVIEIKFDHQVYLAPTFDHAASLGRSETDENRLKRLSTHDKNYHITSYIQKAKSAFYERPGDSKPLSTLDAFYKVATQRKAAATAWLRQLEQVTESHGQTIFQQLPEEIISPVTIDFSMKLLNLNQQRLLSLREKLL